MADGMSLAAVDAELDKVLRPLSGLALFRENVFRVTGLPVDASPAQVRRRREEMAMAARFGAPAPAVDGHAWMQPETDPDALRSAFDAMRNPALRLTHELLWLRPDAGDDHPHNQTVRRHGELLQLEAQGTRLREDETEEAWLDCLDAWAETFALDETWGRARRRVREIDDPRLTIATVRRLEERLPALVVGVNVALAAQAVRSGDAETAWWHMELVEDSDFSDALVRRVARDTADPAVTKIETLCEETEQRSGPGEGLEPVREMLSSADSPLVVVSTLLGDDDPLTEALKDRIAGTVNGCAVQYFNETSNGAATLPMLRRAAELACDQEIAGLVEENLRVVQSQVDGLHVYTGGPGGPAVDAPTMDADVPPAIAAMCRAGGVNAAAARMRAWRRWTRDPVEKARLSAILDDPRGLISPVQNVPSTGCFFFLGGHLYGAKDMQVTSQAVRGMPEYTCIRTYFVTFLWIPLIPVAAHLTGWDNARGAAFGGRVPLGAVARWYRLLVLLGLPLAALAIFTGLGAAVIAVVAGVLVGFATVCLVLRQVYLYSWVRRYR